MSREAFTNREFAVKPLGERQSSPFDGLSLLQESSNYQNSISKPDLVRVADATRANALPAAAEGRPLTEQFPSDVLFHKAFRSSDEFAYAPWQGKNQAQRELLKTIFDPKVKELAGKLPAGMLEAIAGSPKEVNDFLEKQKFGRLLRETSGDDAIAAVMNIKHEWRARDSKDSIKRDDGVKDASGRDFQAFDKDGLEIHNINGNKIVRLDTMNGGLEVYAMPIEKNANGYDVMKEAKSLLPQLAARQADEKGTVRIPKVAMDVTESLPWLVGMKGGDLRIAQAIMQTKLNMDQNGFEAKQALAATATRSIQMHPQPIHTISRDFAFVVAKAGQPIFAIPVPAKYWKAPAK